MVFIKVSQKKFHFLPQESSRESFLMKLSDKNFIRFPALDVNPLRRDDLLSLNSLFMFYVSSILLNFYIFRIFNVSFSYPVFLKNFFTFFIKIFWDRVFYFKEKRRIFKRETVFKRTKFEKKFVLELLGFYGNLLPLFLMVIRLMPVTGIVKTNSIDIAFSSELYPGSFSARHAPETVMRSAYGGHVPFLSVKQMLFCNFDRHGWLSGDDFLSG